MSLTLEEGALCYYDKLSAASGTSIDLIDQTTLAAVTLAVTPGSLKKAVVKLFMKRVELEGLIDNGSSESFIHLDLIKHHVLDIYYLSGAVFIASTFLFVWTSGSCEIDLKFGDRDYQVVHLAVLSQLCSDVVLGQYFQQMHDSITLKYWGGLPPLVICGLNTLKVDTPELFANLTADCNPISAKSPPVFIQG